MGFMDKAKKLAEQAQQKLDEAQNQFNQNAAPQSAPEEGGVRYDEHGRPVPQAPPAGAGAPTPDPSAPPAADAPSEAPASPSAPPAPTSEEREGAPPGGANRSPDPFKPLQ